MLTLKSAIVKEIARERLGYMEAVVDIEGREQRAICYTSLIGEVAPGDEVVVNTTAVDLELGTGGYHFILWNLSKKSVETGGVSEERGHIMKLRYTPLQLKVLAAEEEASPYYDALKDATELEGMPVVVGTLHSQLPAIAVTLKELRPNIKIAYIMTDGAALPLAFSNLAAELRALQIIDTTITVGHAFGGDIEAINIYSGLAAAKFAAGADMAIVTMGPGIVGSGTKLGYTGIEQGQIINAVNSLKGTPIAVPRISFADPRERHFGISHHTITALKLAALSPAVVTLPRLDEVRMEMINDTIFVEAIHILHRVETVDASITLPALEKRGMSPTTMGRTVAEDPEFFMAAGAAGVYAARL